MDGCEASEHVSNAEWCVMSFVFCSGPVKNKCEINFRVRHVVRGREGGIGEV